MSHLTVTLRPDALKTRLLATWMGDDCLRAVLPSHPVDPRAPTELLEALAAWLGEPAHAAIVVDRRAPVSFVEDLLGPERLLSDTALVQVSVVPARRARRLRGPGDLRTVYAVHGRWS